MDNNIVIIGSSGHAKVAIDIIEKENKYNIIGLIDRFSTVGRCVLGYSVIATELTGDLVKNNSIIGGFIAVGDNWVRNQEYINIKSVIPDFKFINAIHPSATIANDVMIDDGTIIMAGAIVNSSTTIGQFCILNTNSSIDHDCILEKFSSVAPSATLGGNVRQEAFSAIMMGANICQRVSIGKHSVIGAGSLVLTDIPSYTVAYGVPAKPQRKRTENENYL